MSGAAAVLAVLAVLAVRNNRIETAMQFSRLILECLRTLSTGQLVKLTL